MAALLLLKPPAPEEGKQEDKEHYTSKGVSSDTWRCTVFLPSGHRIRKAIGDVGAVEHRGISG